MQKQEWLPLYIRDWQILTLDELVINYCLLAYINCSSDSMIYPSKSAGGGMFRSWLKFTAYGSAKVRFRFGTMYGCRWESLRCRSGKTAGGGVTTDDSREDEEDSHSTVLMGANTGAGPSLG
jgi:hypothetical protein